MQTFMFTNPLLGTADGLCTASHRSWIMFVYKHGLGDAKKTLTG